MHVDHFGGCHFPFQCSHHSSQSSIGCSRLPLKNSLDFTNSRPMAARRRKQEVTKTNAGGCRGGHALAEARWTALSISQLHSQTASPAPSLQPPPPPPTIYLSAGGRHLMARAPAFDESVCVRACQLGPLQVGSWNKQVHLPDFPP